MTRRTLVARLDSVGDVLLSGPAIRAIAASDEVDELWMLCGPQGAPAAKLLPGVDRVLSWSSPWIADPAPTVSRAETLALCRMIEACGPERAVILTSFHQSPLPLALLLRLAGVLSVAGASVDHAGTLLDVRLLPGEDFPEDQPEVHRALAIARAAGFDPPPGDDDRLAVLPPPEVTELVGDAPYVAVHPGAAVPSRQWPAAHQAATVRSLAERGIRVVVTGTPADRTLTAAVAGETALDLGGLTTLPQLAGVLAGASVVISGNTGPAHLAAAVRTPVVSLFSPVVPAIRWAPWGVPTVILGDQAAACAGTRARECPVAGHPCLTGIDPTEVVEACLSLMATTRAVPV